MVGSAYVVGVEPHWVQVVRQDLPIADLPDELVGRTLAQISDLHVGPYVEDDYLRGAVRQVADLAPDMVAITGDVMTYRNNQEIERATDILGELGEPPLGTFAVLGNHDYGPGAHFPDVAAALIRSLEDSGIVMLRNAYIDVAGLRIAGMDDLWGGQFAPEHVTPALRGGRASLVLSHNPDSVDRGDWRGYRGWTLCGHTHGGQCRLPFGPAPILPVKNTRYVAGHIPLADGGQMYINRGLGYLHRIRFNARPEITLFSLSRKSDV